MHRKLIIVNNNFYGTCDVIVTDFIIIIELGLFIYFHPLPYLLSVDQIYASFLSRVLIFVVYIEAKTTLSLCESFRQKIVFFPRICLSSFVECLQTHYVLCVTIYFEQRWVFFQFTRAFHIFAVIAFEEIRFKPVLLCDGPQYGRH